MANSGKWSPDELAARVRSLLARRVRPGDELVLGLSGGIDSVVALHVLHGLAAELGFRLSALHVNHRISPHAGAWADFCQRLCEGLGIPLTIEAVDLGPHRDAGLEGAARLARYRALLARPADFVVLAHHLDDQAETLLLQLLRGAGVRGLSAMPEIRAAVGVQPRVLRPFLEAPRTSIAEYAARHGLRWVEDDSNADETRYRNFLRYRALPLLAERFPAYRQTLSRAARHFAECAQLLDDLAEQDARAAVSDGRLLTVGLATLSRPRAANLLRWFLRSHGIPLPDAARLDEMLRQLLGARRDAGIRIEHAGWQLHRFDGAVHVVEAPPPVAPGLCVEWRGESELALPGLGRVSLQSTAGLGIRRAGLVEPVTVRLRQGGERLRLDDTRPRRTLKNLLREARVPPWQRDRLPLLFCGERLVWVPGIGIDCAFQACGGEPALLPDWRR